MAIVLEGEDLLTKVLDEIRRNPSVIASGKDEEISKQIKKLDGEYQIKFGDFEKIYHGLFGYDVNTVRPEVGAPLNFYKQKYGAMISVDEAKRIIMRDAVVYFSPYTDL